MLFLIACLASPPATDYSWSATGWLRAALLLHCVSVNQLSSFSSRGYYTDGPSIVSSLVLLLVLLALMFQRVLGLDRFLTKALK